MKNRPARTFNQNFIRQLVIFTLSTIVIGLAGYFVIMGLFRFYSFSISGAEDWSLLEGFVGALSLSILAGGLTVTVADRIRADVAERREKTKLSFDIYQAIFEKLTDPEQEAARRWILANIPVKKDGEDLAAWYEQTHARITAAEDGMQDDLAVGHRSVKMTMNCFDYIGFIASHYWEIEDDSLDWLSPPIAKVWTRIGPYISHVRTLRGTGDYYIFAESIGDLCIQWRRERGLPEEEYAGNTP